MMNLVALVVLLLGVLPITLMAFALLSAIPNWIAGDVFGYEHDRDPVVTWSDLTWDQWFAFVAPPVLSVVGLIWFALWGRGW